MVEHLQAISLGYLRATMLVFLQVFEQEQSLLPSTWEERSQLLATWLGRLQQVSSLVPMLVSSLARERPQVSYDQTQQVLWHLYCK